MSESFVVETVGLDKLDERIARLSKADRTDLLEGIGAEVESQTRRRIHDSKTAPDGHEWTPWLPSYAKTRTGNQSLLVSHGDLLESIQYVVDSSDEVAVGSNLIYAATHQEGDPLRNIVDRPFLGLSDSDEADIEAVVTDFFDALWESK